MPTDPLEQTVRALMPQAWQDLHRLVALRSVADPEQFPPAESQRAAQVVIDAFAELGIGNLASIPTSDGSRAVVGEAPAPDGAPTVLLYAHYDVQPPMDESAWRSPPFELTERDGRWYGRGAADCKGNIVMHLTALRALGGGRYPVGVKVLVEGAEERGSRGMQGFVAEHADRLRADAIVIGDAGNVSVGAPTVTTSLRGVANVIVHVKALEAPVHSGTFGGAAPDALAALIRTLASLRDERGSTTVRGLDSTGTWAGSPYPEERFRADAGVLPGVELLGNGAVADMLWARPALTVLGIDVPPVEGAVGAIQPEARALLNLRVPPGTPAGEARDALVAHLRAAAPWGVQVEIETVALGEAFRAPEDGPAGAALIGALSQAYRRDVVTEGQGGSIPVCAMLAQAMPQAEMMLIGVEEPECLIHAPNESVDPSEIERMALAEALFLRRYAAAAGGGDPAL